jgi:ribosomal protein S18 acetylase RimI-like enzyme
MADNRFEIRKIETSDEKLYRRLRIEAVRNNPKEMEDSLEDLLRLSGKDWLDRVKKIAVRPTDEVALISSIRGLACGLVGATAVRADAALGVPMPHAVVFGLWVENQYRGQGIGRALLSGSIAWAERHQCAYQYLLVERTNAPAIKLYESQHFRFDGWSAPSKFHAGVVLDQMQRRSD